jgi:hypothetical protein
LTTDSSLIEQYLELGLRLGKLSPDLVDSYYGPAAIRIRVDGEPVPDPAVLLEDSEDLVESMVGVNLDEARMKWLRAQVNGLQTAARVLSGARLSYADEVEGCHGIRARIVPEDVFVEAHSRLDQALPGRGNLAERYQRWLSSQIVPAEAIVPALRSLAEELRDRTSQLLGLPAGEGVDFKTIRDKQWFGFASYKGGLRSDILINIDLPIWSFRLIEFVAHEVYPGHHTEGVWKEHELVRNRGYQEESVRLQPTPQSLIAEGLAELALEVIRPDDADALSARLLTPLGIPYDEEIAHAVRLAKNGLRFVRTNILQLLDQETISAHQAHKYARKWMLEPHGYVGEAVASLISRPWRSYESCYTEGYELCKAFVDGEPLRFKRLLAEQLTPADLIRPSPK